MLSPSLYAFVVSNGVLLRIHPRHRHVTFQQPAESIRRRYDAGRQRRTRLPRAAQGQWAAAPDRADPLATLASVNQGRGPALLPEKNPRVGPAPVALFRGPPLVCASGLAARPATRPPLPFQ